MKKFLAIALIAVSFAACNEGEKTEETTITTEDTTMMTTPVDTMMVTPDTMMTMPMDSTMH